MLHSSQNKYSNLKFIHNKCFPYLVSLSVVEQNIIRKKKLKESTFNETKEQQEEEERKE